MDDHGEQGRVRVERSDNALSQPQFIIHADGKYYLTLAVWEYDPGRKETSDGQKQGLRNIAGLFERLSKSGTLPSVMVPEIEVAFFQHTS